MAATQEIRRVIVVDKEGEITETAGISGTDVVGGNDDGKEAVEENDLIPQPTKRSKRSETIGVSTDGNFPLDTEQIRHISGMKTNKIEQSFDLEALIAELMAGNPDVDIYVLPYGIPLTQRIKELGILW